MRKTLLAAVAVFPLLHAGLAKAQEAPTQTLKIALRDDPDLLDPTLARTVMGRIVFAGLCDKLFDIDEKLNIVPQLATGYEWSDSKTLILHLRDGVLFHDGTKMDAGAVKYSLERHMTMPGSSRRAEVSTIDQVVAVDPLTVRIMLKTPTSPLIAQFTDRAGMIVSQKAAEAAGKDFALKPVCTGPFKFTERVAQDRIVLDRFPEYWDAKNIHFARVTYLPITNTATRLANLQAGAIDLTEQVIPSDLEAVRKNPKLKVVESDGLGYNSVTWNTGHGPRAATPIGQSALVRKAFELSIDREAAIQVVYAGAYTPTAQAVAASSPYYSPDVKPPARDVAKAKDLLKQAGVKLPVTFTMMTPTNSDSMQMAEVLQAMSAEAGFDMKIQATEFSSSLDAADRGDFEGYLIAWSGRVDPDGNLFNFVHSSGTLNYGHYANPDVDQWLTQGRVETTIPARQALYAKVAARVAQDQPLMYLYDPKNIVGMSVKVSGFRPISDGLIRLQGLSKAP